MIAGTAGAVFMKDYRLYCLDGAEQIASMGEWIQAKSDDDAIAIVGAKKLLVGCEIWEGNRLVAYVPAHAY